MPKNTLFLVVLVLSSLVACQPTPVQETAIPTEQPLLVEQTQATSSDFVVWGLSGLTEEVSSYMATIFEEQHPGINVVVTDEGWDEALRQNLENAILIGRPPDVVVGENYFRYFASLGQMQPLDSIVEPVRDKLIPATYQGAIYQDQIYAVPILTGVFGLERNCAVITQAGLDCETPPQYWDEFLEEVRAINEAGAGEYYGFTLQGPGGTSVGAAFRLAIFHAQLDAMPCSGDLCNIPYFDNPAMIPVMEFVRELSQYTPPGLITNNNEGQVYEALFRGISSYQIAGSWHINWARETGCEDCRYSAIPYPREGHPASIIVGNVLVGAPTNSQHPELALEWLSLMLRDDVQALIYSSTGRLPVTRPVLTELRETVDTATQSFIDELLNNPSLGILPQWETNPREVWGIYNTMIEGVLTTNRPVAEIMGEAQEAVERLNR